MSTFNSLHQGIGFTCFDSRTVKPRQRHMAGMTSSLSLPEPPALDVQVIENWYVAYITDSYWNDKSLAAIREVDEDSVDDIDFEDQVQNVVPLAAVEKGYCKICRYALANWTPWGNANEPWATTTIHLAAASKAGCRLCAFFWSCMDPSEIDTFRKIERRLQFLGKAVSSHIKLFPNELEIAYPGKRWTSPTLIHGRRRLCYTKSLFQPCGFRVPVSAK